MDVNEDTVCAEPGDASSLREAGVGYGSQASRLAAVGATLAYEQRTISEGLDVQVPADSFTVIVGPNACGKSTLLRALARLLKPKRGSIVLDGKAVHSLPAKSFARTVGLLPQSSLAPDGIVVGDLVSRGRYPHQGIIRQWSAEDARAVAAALAATNTTELSARLIDELSGGQRQRVWVAMALAQETPLLLLDEPTTFLDIVHQFELLELFRKLHRSGRTLVAVLHDLNQAARYATHIIAMKEGRVVAEGAPRDIITVELVREVFELECVVVPDPVTGSPMVVPLGSAAE
jgi:ABC-type cobalamin/Fe3+-siderophores transport system ATPase subunit